MKIVIDKEVEIAKLEDMLENLTDDKDKQSVRFAINVIEGFEERPTGHWIEHYDTEDGFTWLTCSRCMFKAYEEDYNFCPNCGAEMGKEAENENNSRN